MNRLIALAIIKNQINCLYTNNKSNLNITYIVNHGSVRC